MTEEGQLKVIISATGVVRDKDGRVKCEIRVEGESTPEQIRQIFGSEVTPDGSQSPDSGP